MADGSSGWLARMAQVATLPNPVVEYPYYKMDPERIVSLLKTLSPKEEKTIRMLYGIGCERAHTFPEIAQEFDAPNRKMREIFNRASRRLIKRGITHEELQALGRLEKAFLQSRPLAEFEIGKEQIEVESAISRLLNEIHISPEILQGRTSREFEELVAEVWQKLGYSVELTAATRDRGRDVVAIRKNEAEVRYLIECKRYDPAHKVGVQFVRALYGVKTDEKATKAFLATTSSFTRDALAFFQSHKWELELRDYDGVLDWLRIARQYRQSKASGLFLPVDDQDKAMSNPWPIGRH